MKKVEIYKNEVKIFEGSMAKGSTFLGKDSKYLFRVYNGYTELKHNFQYLEDTSSNLEFPLINGKGVVILESYRFI